MVILLAPAFAVPGPQDELRPGEPITVELAAPAEPGKAESATTFAFTPDFSGGAYVWASSATVPPRLTILSESGEELQVADGSKLATTPLLFALLQPGRRLVVQLTAADPQRSGRCSLHLEVARETDLTDDAVAMAKEALADARALGARQDLVGARELLAEAVRELCAVEGSAYSARVTLVLSDLARTAFELRSYDAGAEAMEQVLSFRLRTLPDDHPDLQRERGNAAVLHFLRGNLHEARGIQRALLDVYERILPEEHPDRLLAEWNLGATLSTLGELEEALRLTDHVVDVRSRTLSEEHPDLLGAQENLASILRDLGNLHRALELQEHVFAVSSRTFLEGDPQVQKAAQGLALILQAVGDHERARALQERVLEVLASAYAEDDSQLLWAQANLASTLKMLGDLDGARSLEENVLALRSRSLPDDHPDLQWARANLASTLHLQGEHEESLSISRKVLAVRAQSLPDDHLLVQTAREHIAISLGALGEHEAARELQETILAVRRRRLSENHRDVQTARINLANTLASLGRALDARQLREGALGSYERTFPPDHPFSLLVRRELLWTAAALGDREAVTEHGVELARAIRRSASRSACLDSQRQVEARALDSSAAVDSLLSLADGAGMLEPFPELLEEAFATLETLRGLGLLGASFVRAAGEDPGNAERRAALLAAGQRISALSGAGAERELLAAAVRKRDALQRSLLQTVFERAQASLPRIEPGTGDLAAALEEGVALVTYWRYRRAQMEPGQAADFQDTPSLVAFVVRRNAPLARVELGPIEPIEEAIDRWRTSLGAPIAVRGERGSALPDEPGRSGDVLGERVRALVLDPVLQATGGTRRLVVVLDDALHLVPLDGLPLDGGMVGDRFEVQVRTTLWELLAPPSAPSTGGALVAVGGIDYGTLRVDGEHPEAAPDQVSFRALPASRAEVEAIAELAAAHGLEAVQLLCDERATKVRLAELAADARYLHLATHGYFGAPRVLSEGRPRDAFPIDARTGLGSSLPGAAWISRLSPMALCGLVLSGANRRPTDDPTLGLLTAEELAAFELSRCELAVLSACDTNVGLRSAGQGVASLQKVLAIAGARSVITSLWKVPDEATKDLMVDFYGRIWLEGKPKHQALWEAKLQLRAAVDEGGIRKHTPRDWAGWVLTGEPD